MREQSVLAAAGVLKLIDQQMLNAVGECLRGIARQVVLALESSLRDLCDFNEVGLARFRKDDAQLARGVAQENETGPDDLPVAVGVARGRQIVNGRESGFERGLFGKSRNQSSQAALFLLGAGGESVPLIDFLAEASACKKQIGQAPVRAMRLF